jgi:hypothetical protein
VGGCGVGGGAGPTEGTLGTGCFALGEQTGMPCWGDPASGRRWGPATDGGTWRGKGRNNVEWVETRRMNPVTRPIEVMYEKLEYSGWTGR